MPIPTTNSELQVAARREDVARVIVLADDLTGACDSGVAFLASGRSVSVLLDVEAFDRVADGLRDVWSFTTESRNLSVEDATQRLVTTMAKLPHEGSLFFKKVDSAARGHMGAEIVAALRVSGAKIALVAPAFPEAGRTVIEGVLRVSDFSGQDVEIPLQDLFAAGVDMKIESLADGSEMQVAEGIARAVADGVEILLCGASTQGHLRELAEAGLRLGQPVLWAGSAGLAHALAEELPAVDVRDGFGTKMAPVRAGRTLLFVGTPHTVTRMQMSRLDLEVRESFDVELGTTHEDEVCTAFAGMPVAALILTGGDTAAFVLHALGATEICLWGEVARGIPWGVIRGGAADGCVVVTKSGGFGGPEALVQAFEFCERRQRETT